MIPTLAISILILTSTLGIPVQFNMDNNIEMMSNDDCVMIDLTPVNLFSRELEMILQTDEGLSIEHDVIIQFRDEITNNEIEVLNELNIPIRHKFKVLNAISTLAKGAALNELVENDFVSVSHIELNYPMIPDMEMSLSVINATKAWDSEVVRNLRSLGYIDGSGVTVCVIDTGIDASHPDLDYGRKTLFNLHDVGDANFVETENSDLNYGHGTHVAGTVAGNGDASAGTRSGVAPGANLIGLSVSIPEQMSTPNVETYISGLEWVYEHSKPGQNTWNIRCATNSWHSSVGEYDPDSALAIITEKLAFDNNVITTWSAGNDGRNDPEGNTITTSQQGNTPVAIMVAAYERDGSAVTDFSSRGQVGLNHTYPDLGAPGRSIWSCAARRTLISGGSYIGGNTNPYYLAISGTSMSTPHIAGTVALLWQAAPSMKISYIHEDYSGDESSWWTNPRTYVHEVELILEGSCKYLEPTEEHGVLVENKSTLPGWNGKPTDYVQGYGIVDVQKAVGIALALEELRTKYPDENISVFDAIENYEKISLKKNVQMRTNVLNTFWNGEYSRFQSSRGIPLSSVNQTKKLFIPEDASEVVVDLFYSAVDMNDLSAVDLTINIDFGDDGTIDYYGDLSPGGGGAKTFNIAVSENDGKVWAFDIVGQGLKIQKPLQDNNYVELRAEYDINVNIYFETDVQINFTRTTSIYSKLGFGEPLNVGAEQYINKTVFLYDLSNVEYTPNEPKLPSDEGSEFPYMFCLAGLVLVGIICTSVVIFKKIKQKKQY